MVKLLFLLNFAYANTFPDLTGSIVDHPTNRKLIIVTVCSDKLAKCESVEVRKNPSEEEQELMFYKLKQRLYDSN